MGTAPAPVTPPQKNYKPYLTAGVVAVVLLVLVFPIKKYFYDRPPAPSKPQITQIDPLCDYVSGSLKLKCVVGPAGEGVFGPGRYVNFDSSAQQKVPFSKGSLFISPCLLPGAQSTDLLADLQTQEQTNEVGFDNITYTLERHFLTGAQIPIPKLDNLLIKAGPKLSEVQTITLSAPHAWIKIVDENKFIDLLSRAAITPTCINDILDNKYSVISQAAIAKDYEVTFTDKFGHSANLSAAVAKGEVKIDVGGESGSDIDETIKKASANALVVAVDFFPAKIFSQNREKLVSPAFIAKGTTHVRIKATGGPGFTWQREHTGSVEAPLNVFDQEPLGPAFCIRRPATAQLSSTVVPLPLAKGYGTEQTFEFGTRGVLIGGEAPTSSSCNAGSGSIEAEIQYETVVETIVKSADSSVLSVSIPPLPDVSVRVLDWTGKALPEKHRSSTSVEFGLEGPGVYRTEVSIHSSLAAQGVEPHPVNATNQFVVNIR